MATAASTTRLGAGASVACLTSTGNVRPGMDSSGQSPKYAANFSPSRVAEVTTSFSGPAGPRAAVRFKATSLRRPKSRSVFSDRSWASSSTSTR